MTQLLQLVSFQTSIYTNGVYFAYKFNSNKKSYSLDIQIHPQKVF